MTVIDRLGGSWNAALESVGLATSTIPEGFGAARYSASDFEEALRKFIRISRADGTPTSYKEYEEWVRSQRSEGHNHPSGPSVRLVYPNWNDALRTSGDRSGVNRVTERVREDAKSGAEIKAQAQVIEVAEREITERAEAGTLTPAQAANYQNQIDAATAQIEFYDAEEARWADQKSQWEKAGEQADKQFSINLWLAIAVGAGSVIVPIIVWALETFGPQSGGH